ncbi:MAG: MotA/TolQ/ExbB proton channel family protein [Lachnospiraceae bacterium]|nr:MotA/TolQ/ExbB proton channel family protein [Lachnospiraceae bacterium]
MSNRKWYEWLLTITYVVMILVCVYLNVFTAQKEGIANIAVNVVMFLIVGAIFLSCEIGSFLPLNDLIADLKKVTEKIRKDAMNSHQFLWEKYSEREKRELFTNETLKEQFQDYLYELSRIERMDKSYYKSDIEDYINYDVTDAVVHRNMLNQVAGAMTGLGILGTFIGLSLGLQSFNTGTTAEITNSIAPLMDGIKVAFHTSIYGMVFSLIFNFVYKSKIDEAEKAVGEFVTSYKKYVLPDTTTDGVNKLMELQQQQTKAIGLLANTVGVQLSEELSNLLKPQFDRFDKTLQDFGNMATRNQVDALNQVVHSFIAEMNKSLSGSFSQMAYTIDQAYQLQQGNADQMKEILAHTGATAENLHQIEAQTSAIIGALDTYTKDVRDIQTEFADNISNLQVQSASNEVLVRQEQKYLSDLVTYRKSMDDSISTFSRQLKVQENLLANLNRALTNLPKDIDDTFHVIDDNLVEVETHFRDTILQIKEVTDQVPDVIADSYDDMQKALNRAADAVEDLSATVENLARENGNGGNGSGRGTWRR